MTPEEKARLEEIRACVENQRGYDISELPRAYGDRQWLLALVDAQAAEIANLATELRRLCDRAEKAEARVAELEADLIEERKTLDGYLREAIHG